MSNTPNYRHRRHVLCQTFKGSSGGSSPNECLRPPGGSSKSDLVELHREKMRSLRYHRRGPSRMTPLQSQVEKLRQKGGDHLRAALHNFSAHPRGVKRDRPARVSIWPKGKVAQPGRMLNG